MNAIGDLWASYKATGERADRDRLIVHYQPLIRSVVARAAAGLPKTVEHGDLASYGVFGLLDAIEKFDLGRGYRFETYAVPRIRGAILDGLRSADWVPRSVRAKARAVERAQEALEGELRRSPTDSELAVELDVSREQLQATLGQVASTAVAPLEAGNDLAVNPDAGWERSEVEELRTGVGEAIQRLPARELIVLVLYYREGLTLAEIGQVLGVTESRVCQIHTKAVAQSRDWVLAADVRT